MFIKSFSVLDQKVNFPDCRQSLNLKKTNWNQYVKIVYPLRESGIYFCMCLIFQLM